MKIDSATADPASGVSIVIRTSSSEKPLRDLLSRLPIGAKDEIIVVDTGSKDGTVALAERAGARVIRNEGPFHYSRTLNLGFAAARNEQVLVLSAHCLPVNRDFLARYRQAVREIPEGWGVIYGMQVLSKRQYARLDKVVRFYSGAEALRELQGGGNPNALYSKRAWALHPFNENIATGEDWEWKQWAADTGLVLALAAEACVFYRHPRSPLYRFRKACEEVRIRGDSAQPMSYFEFTIAIAYACRHLLWEEFLPRAWMGEVAHFLGAFVTSRRLLK